MVTVYYANLKKKDRAMMHFDIIVAEETSVENVFRFGRNYLRPKGLIDF